MITQEQTMKMLEISNNILEIVDNADEFSRGDLQGAIEAQVMIAMQSGAKMYKEELKARLMREYDDMAMSGRIDADELYQDILEIIK